MLSKLFTVYDVKAGAHSAPMCFNTVGLAMRAFQQLVQDQTTTVGQNPEDFTFFEVGTFDNNTGRVVPYDALVPVATALDFVNEEPSHGVPQPEQRTNSATEPLREHRERANTAE